MNEISPQTHGQQQSSLAGASLSQSRPREALEAPGPPGIPGLALPVPAEVPVSSLVGCRGGGSPLRPEWVRALGTAGRINPGTLPSAHLGFLFRRAGKGAPKIYRKGLGKGSPGSGGRDEAASGG